jgi:hypothetical protein
MHDSGLGRGVSGISDDPQLGLRPFAMQIDGILDGRDHIVASMHDDGGDGGEAAGFPQKLIVG